MVTHCEEALTILKLVAQPRQRRCQRGFGDISRRRGSLLEQRHEPCRSLCQHIPHKLRHCVRVGTFICDGNMQASAGRET